jgi:hypothetical protein
VAFCTVILVITSTEVYSFLIDTPKGQEYPPTPNCNDAPTSTCVTSPKALGEPVES